MQFPPSLWGQYTPGTYYYVGGTLTNGFLHFIRHLLAFLLELLDHVLSQLSITPRSVETSECVCIAGTGVVLCQQYYYYKNEKKNLWKMKTDLVMAFQSPPLKKSNKTRESSLPILSPIPFRI